MSDQNQSYANHTQLVPLYHYFLLGLLLVTLLGAAVNLYGSIGDSQRIYSASLIFVLTIATIVLAFVSRVFALKAQDRAIRAEEQIRHFVLTNTRLDPRLTLGQMIALRFASDDEFPALAARAASENLSGDAIKRAVKNWRADTHRV